MISVNIATVFTHILVSRIWVKLIEITMTPKQCENICVISIRMNHYH